MWPSGGDGGALGQVGGAANGGKEGGPEQSTEQARKTLLATIEEKMRMEGKHEDVRLHDKCARTPSCSHLTPHPLCLSFLGVNSTHTNTDADKVLVCTGRQRRHALLHPPLERPCFRPTGKHGDGMRGREGGREKGGR